MDYPGSVVGPHVGGFIVRLLLPTIISAFIVWLWVTPFDRVPVAVPRGLYVATAKVLNFPVAVAGGIGAYRGFDVWPDDHSTGCCFCSRRYVSISQMRVSVPAYLLLLYVPTLVRRALRWLWARRTANEGRWANPHPIAPRRS